MKFSRQFDQMDCGPACVRMVASCYGRNYPLSYPLDITLEHVSFSYTGHTGQEVLHNISFRIPAGKMTAIVGESGSGKTTLMKLLLTQVSDLGKG